MSLLTARLDDDLAGVVESARRSLVQVRRGRKGAGAGTIWHADGLVLTNGHVVGNGPVEVALSDGRSLSARLLARNVELDLAALAVDAADLPTITLGESKSIRPGQVLLSLGHPFGVVGAAAAGVAVGVGSGVGPEEAEAPSSRREWLVVNLGLRPGNSGGPLVDVAGRLVGINTIMTGPQVGAAVPVHVVKRFLRDELGSGT